MRARVAFVGWQSKLDRIEGRRILSHGARQLPDIPADSWKARLPFETAKLEARIDESDLLNVRSTEHRRHATLRGRGPNEHACPFFRIQS